ncbi:MAG: alkaline phosphatase family protein [Planctomycetes bacterium]|nr:alkaline phosphatase family protein [Planctomycetota bacterium]
MSDCHLFFFVDAMGAAVIRGHPVIEDLGRTAALRSVFGYSSACVPSILSGRWPEEHLHWSYFTYRGPATGLKVPRWLRWLPPAVRDRGRVRHHLSKAVKRANGIAGYFQMYMMPIDQLHQYGHCEPRDIFQPGGMNTGGNIADLIAASGAAPGTTWIADWHHQPDENWAAMRAKAADPKCRFMLMYDAAMDAWLHDHTRESPLLDARLGEVRRELDAVLAAARAAHDRVLFYVFSDHGMCTVRRLVDLFPALERTRLRMHADYHCVIDSTMVRAWYHGDERVRATVRDALSGIDGLRLLTPDEMKRERCAFPDNRFGDDFWLADPHVLLVPSHLGTVPMKGMHGYSCDHEDSDASFVTNDPAAAPRTIVDVYRLMADAVHAVA